jgi:probable F420-dependent oxidoreductase
MRWGLHLGNFGVAARAERILALAAAAERLGFDSVWASDHVAVPAQFTSGSGLRGSTYDADTGAGFFEALATLAVVAGATRRVRLGTSVLVLPLRNPLLLARELATLDALSGGRIELGVGAGWLAEEFAAMAAPPFPMRGAVLDEYLAILQLAWTQPEARFEGRFHSFGDLRFGPRPVQTGGPPITVGGHGARALRRAARFDGWQAARERPEGLVAPLATLRREVEAGGRSWDAFRVLVRCRLGPIDGPDADGDRFEIAGSADEVGDTVSRYADLGVTDLIAGVPADLPTATAVAWIERLADVVLPVGVVAT